MDGGRTRLRAHIRYEPEDFLEGVGDALGFMSRRVRADLERFKNFIERRGSETGAWRGEIHGGRVESTPGDERAPNL